MYFTRCSDHSLGGSTARSNRVMLGGKQSSRMASTISGTNVVRFTDVGLGLGVVFDVFWGELFIK